MTEAKQDRGPAFPAQHSIDGNWVKEPLAEFSGMSLRDYFAASALTGLCSLLRGQPESEMQLLAPVAYAVADAMLKARETV